MLFAAPENESPVHRLHPLVKVAAAIGLTALSLFLDDPAALSVMVLFLLALLLISKIRLRTAAALYLVLLLLLFFYGSYHASGSVDTGIAYTMRLVVLMAGIPLCAMTTSPQDLARSLSKVGLPNVIVVSLLMVFRFFPALAREMSEIRQADMLRGTASHGPLRRAYRSMIVPVTFMLFEHTDRVALALELRGFDQTRERTWHSVPVPGWNDALFAAAVLLFCASAMFFEAGAVP